MIEQIKNYYNQVIIFIKQYPVLAFILMYILYIILTRSESFEMITVGPDSERKSVASLIILDTKDRVKLPTSVYEEKRTEIDNTPEMQRVTGIKIWKQIIKPNTAPMKTLAIAKKRKTAENQIKNGGDRLQSMKQLQDAAPDFEGIQTNWIN